MLRRSRHHYRVHQARWRQRRRALTRICLPQGDATDFVLVRRFADRLWTTQRPDDRRVEERAYRQQVRRALARGGDPPRYRHDWAD
jgi:hypothetical protein